MTPRRPGPGGPAALRGEKGIPGPGGWWGAVLLLGLALGACATHRPPEARAFHEDFEAARYRSAVAAFRADSSLRADPRVMVRMGLLYASPSSPVYDPDRAIQVFETLRRRHPESGHRRTAGLMIPLLRKIGALETAVDSLVLRTRTKDRARSDSLSTAADSLRAETGNLRARIDELESVISELRTQLRRLKAVDLGEDPAPDSTGRFP